MPPTTRRQRKNARTEDGRSKRPQSRVRKVTLRVSQPSAPDTPAAIPVPPPLPLPPPEVHRQPQTPPLPHLPPPHLPPTMGLPIPNDGQHTSVGPPTYAHPYSGMFYPPGYPPPPHHPYGASIGAAPLQPWGYPPYPTAPPPAPFLAHLVATHRTAAGDEDLLTREARGHVGHDIPRRWDKSGAGGDVNANVAALPSTVGARSGRSYPNKEVSSGVWQFQIEVVDDHIKHTFTAQTDMKWKDFLNEVHQYFDAPRSEVKIAFRISGEPGTMSSLASEEEWTNAIVRLQEKVKSARTRAVSMEIKNMHESARTRVRARGYRKGKEKRSREDDVPPELTPEMRSQLDCLLELQQHLLCQAHSKPGKKTFCLIRPRGENAKDGHKELTHEEMTLWAKEMSLRNVTINAPPNTKILDHPATKKTRTMHAKPEVHVSVNIMPTPGAGSSAVQATYVVSGSSSPTPSPSRLVDISDESPRTIPSSAPEPSVPGPTQAQDPRPSRLLVLLDCMAELRVPTVKELLMLMDAHAPAVGRKYMDLCEELTDLKQYDVVDVYSLPIELLASFGWLRQDSARCIHEYCRDKLLVPLGFMEATSSDENDSLSTPQVIAPDLGECQSAKEETVDSDKVSIYEETEDVMSMGKEEDDEEDEEEDNGYYRATSYEV
ncbi:hypothetical protein H4582DRAFT_2085253 [Lactarius indigo]|nr:hypothetical protein H4582DRAFT_2085253 [Lactarius indigo]